MRCSSFWFVVKPALIIKWPSIHFSSGVFLNRAAYVHFNGWICICMPMRTSGHKPDISRLFIMWTSQIGLLYLFWPRSETTVLYPDSTEWTRHNKLLGEKRPHDGAVSLRGHQLLASQSSGGHITQQPGSVLHEQTRRETDQTLIWYDRHRGHMGRTLGGAEEESHGTHSKKLLQLNWLKI